MNCKTAYHFFSTIIASHISRCLTQVGEAAKETSYICNKSAGFNRCITKALSHKLKHRQLWKNYITWPLSIKLSALPWVNLYNICQTSQLSRWITFYLSFQGLVPGTPQAWSKAWHFLTLRNCPLNGYALFPDAVIMKAEGKIAQFETNKHTSQPSPGHGGFAAGHKRQQNRYQPYSTGWKKN